MEKEVEYISDGNYNYLRFNCGEERKNSYTFKMVTENTIKGLLPCRVRFVNGDTYLYYEIQSKQALYYRFETREINYEDLKNIFYHLCLLGEELEKYLLDFNDIDFDERFVYQNIETGETFFLFYPEKEQKQTFAAFMEYIVKKINHKDAKAVQISYQLYDISRKEYILVREIKQLFEEVPESSAEKRVTGVEMWREENQKEQKDEEKELKEIEKTEWRYEDVEERSGEKKERTKLENIFIPIVLCIVLTILVCVKISFKLMYNQEILLIGGIVADIGIAVFYFVRILYKKRKAAQGNKIYNVEKENTEFYEGTISERVQEDTEWNHMEWEKEESYGKTVFLEPEAENILYGMGKNEKITIKLEKFPFTIGKLKEEADYVLKDNSISRLHARFYKEEKSIYLMDLNSTNGTYKNGFKIPPNKKILLEEGDEITFGKIRFCYR